MTEIIIKPSKKKDKKFDAIIDNSKTVSFGSSSHSDFTKHKDEERKKNYIARHKKNEDWTASGYKTAGWFSKHILWNKPTLEASVKDTDKRFKNLNIKLKV